MIKQNVYLLPENLNQLNNLNMDLELVLLLLIDFTSGTKSFVSVITNVVAFVSLDNINLPDQVK